jgi:hypothetical protein
MKEDERDAKRVEESEEKKNAQISQRIEEDEKRKRVADCEEANKTDVGGGKRRKEENAEADEKGVIRNRVDDLGDEQSRKRYREGGSSSSACPAALEGADDGDNELLLFAEAFSQKNKRKTMIMDVTSNAEMEKAKEMGENRWMKRVVKAIKQHKPKLIIGGHEGVQKGVWSKIYGAQSEINGYFVHVEKVMEGETSPRLTGSKTGKFRDMKNGKTRMIETNSEIIAHREEDPKTMREGKIRDICVLCLSACKSLHMF